MSNDLPISLPEVKSLLWDVTRLTAAVEWGDEKARKELVVKARSLYMAVETPMEALLRMVWAEAPLKVLLRVGLELKLFERLAEDGGKPKTTDELAKAVGAEVDLLSRILKHLAAMSVIREVAADTYEPTRLASALADPLQAATISYSVDVFVSAFFALPEFLKKTHYKVPRDPLNSPFQLWSGEKDHMFEWIHKRPALMQEFNKFMSAYSLSRKRWMEPGCVPIDEVLSNGASKDPDSVFLVDVGGGNGHDLIHFQKNHPDIAGRLILQDLPGTIETVKDKLPSGIEAMSHDFFTPQPIKGARAYYLHSVLHDWPTSKCHQILSNLIPALQPGYSKVLINENVIPDQNAYWEATGLDWVMLTLYSSEERREKVWRELCEGVGLKINKIWEFEKGTEAVIECELADEGTLGQKQRVNGEGEDGLGHVDGEVTNGRKRSNANGSGGGGDINGNDDDEVVVIPKTTPEGQSMTATNESKNPAQHRSKRRRRH